MGLHHIVQQVRIGQRPARPVQPRRKTVQPHQGILCLLLSAGPCSNHARVTLHQTAQRCDNRRCRQHLYRIAPRAIQLPQQDINAGLHLIRLGLTMRQIADCAIIG